MSKKITRIIRRLWVDFIIADGVQKPPCIFCSEVLVMFPRSRQFWKLILLHAIPHIYMTTTCLCGPSALDVVL